MQGALTIMTIKQYAVIGLGRFGTSVARRLHEAGQEVLGIDVNEERVEDAEFFVTHAVVADTTEEKALTSIGITNFDCVIVAIGNDMQSSILTVSLLKELGIKKVIAKALGKRHGQVLDKVGADWIIYPERDMGERVANQLLSPNMLNYIELSKEYSVEEIMIPSKMAGKKTYVIWTFGLNTMLVPSPSCEKEQSSFLHLLNKLSKRKIY